MALNLSLYLLRVYSECLEDEYYLLAWTAYFISLPE
jgi:hypothetical protein